MIDRTRPRKHRTDTERQQLRVTAALSLGIAMVLTPLFMPPAASQGVDVLHAAGWLVLALGALWQWRQPRRTPAALARAGEADRIVHRRVRMLREPMHRVPESAVSAWRQHGGH